MDQPFWGKRVHAVGAGPLPVPISSLTADKLERAINVLIRPEVRMALLSNESAFVDRAHANPCGMQWKNHKLALLGPRP